MYATSIVSACSAHLYWFVSLLTRRFRTKELEYGMKILKSRRRESATRLVLFVFTSLLSEKIEN